MSLSKRRDGQVGAERIRCAARACSAPGAAGGVFEPLERRQFLSVTIGDAPECDAKTLIYNDPDGTLITVSLKGGSAKFSWTGDFIPDITRGVARFIDMPTIIDTIELAGTNLRSVLSFKTSIPRGADEGVDNLCSVGTITSGPGVGGLGKIVGPNLVIEGDVVVSGRLGQASFHDLGDSETSPPTQLTAESVGNIMLVGGYLNSDVTATAGSIGNLTIKGGSLYGSLNATASIGTIAIVGGDLDADVTAVAGSIGDIVIKDGSLGGSLNAAVSIGKIVIVGGDLNSDVTATAGSIGNITIKDGCLNGSLFADNGSIGNITVIGVPIDESVFGDGSQSWDVPGGEIASTELRAGHNIGKIALTGGGIDGTVITAGGDIGTITTTGLQYKAEFGAAEPWLPRTATWDLAPGDINATVTAGGVLGKIKIKGGNCTGQYEAQSVAGISAQAVLIRDRDQNRAYGGDVTATVYAFESLGPIVAKGVKADVKGSFGFGEEAGKRMFFEDSPGGTMGGTIDLTVRLGLKQLAGQPDGQFEVNEALKCRSLSILSVGGSITLAGDVSFSFIEGDIYFAVKAKPLKFLYGYDDFNLPIRYTTPRDFTYEELITYSPS